jgi:hypothetical protein
VCNGDYDSVVRALRAGGNPNLHKDDTPLIFWTNAMRLRRGILPLLLMAGADPNARNMSPGEGHGMSAMSAVVWLGYYSIGGMPEQEQTVEAVSQLLLAGADPTLKDSQGRDTFYWAEGIHEELHGGKHRQEIIRLLQAFEVGRTESRRVQHAPRGTEH